MLSDAGRQDTPTSTMANISGAHAESILAKIDGGKSESQYRRNDIIYSQGEPAAFIFYIRAGKLKVTVVSEEGKEATVAILLPGYFCGEECLTGHKLRISTATALTECELVKMPKAAIVHAPSCWCRLNAPHDALTNNQMSPA
jgi:hypothetical protein